MANSNPKTVRFLQRVVVTLMVAACYAQSSAGQTPLTLNDLTWKGEKGIADVGTSGVVCGTSQGVNPGGTSGAPAALAVRYRDYPLHARANRVFYFPLYCVTNIGAGNTQFRTWGDLVEYRERTDSECMAAGFPTGFYTGTDPTASCPLLETRRWAVWTNYDNANLNSWKDTGSGDSLTALYWDAGRNVMWWLKAGIYSGTNTFAFGATQLTDTCNGGSPNYCTVGTKWGPFWYGDASIGPGNLRWKAINNSIFEIPTSAQMDLQGCTIAFGGTVGAVGGSGHLGPGLRCFAALPTLNASNADPSCAVASPPAACVFQSLADLGVKMADYSGEFCDPGAPTPARSNAHRNTNYIFVSHPAHTEVDTGMWPPAGGVGFWGMGRDNFMGMTWIETTSRQGIVGMGRQVGPGGMWYASANPLSRASDDCVGTLTRINATTGQLTCPDNARLTGGGYGGPNPIVGTKVSLHCATPSAWNTTDGPGGCGLSDCFTITSVTAPNTVQFTLPVDPVTNGSPDILTGPGHQDVYGANCGGNYSGFARKMWGTPDYLAPARDVANLDNSYGNETMRGAIYMFDPVQIRQVGLLTRNKCSDDRGGVFVNPGGINPTNIGDWSTQWPNIHITVNDATYNGRRETSDYQDYFTANGMFYDKYTGELLWLYGESNSTAATPTLAPPVLHYFNVPQ